MAKGPKPTDLLKMDWQELLFSCGITPTAGEITIYERQFPKRSIWSQTTPRATTYSPDKSIGNFLPGGNTGYVTSIVLNAGGLSVGTESMIRQRPMSYSYSWDDISYIKAYSSLGDTVIETSIGIFGNDNSLSAAALYTGIVFYSSLARSATGFGMPLIEYTANKSALDKYKSDEMPWEEFIDDQGRASGLLRQVAQSRQGHKYLKEWLNQVPSRSYTTYPDKEEDSSSDDDTERELKKVEDLASKGLISEEEQRLMRNKILGI